MKLVYKILKPLGHSLLAHFLISLTYHEKKNNNTIIITRVSDIMMSIMFGDYKFASQIKHNLKKKENQLYNFKNNYLFCQLLVIGHVDFSMHFRVL